MTNKSVAPSGSLWTLATFGSAAASCGAKKAISNVAVSIGVGLIALLVSLAFASEIETYQCTLHTEGETDTTSTIIVDREHKRFNELDANGKELGGWIDATIEGNKLEPRYYDEYVGNIFELDLSTGKGEVIEQDGTTQYSCVAHSR